MRNNKNMLKEILTKEILIPEARAEAEEAYKQFNVNLKKIKNLSNEEIEKEMDRVYHCINFYTELVSNTEINDIKPKLNYILQRN